MYLDFQKQATAAGRPLIKRILGRIGPLGDFVAAFLPKVWILDGIERHSAQPLTVVFAGEVANKNYLADLIFDQNRDERLLGRRWIWRVARQRGPKGQAGALIIAEMGRRVRRMCGASYNYHVPCWIGGTIDPAAFVSRLQSRRSVKEDSRRLRKLNLTWEIGRNPADFDAFFRDMYVPYILSTYGAKAFMMSREAMIASAAKSEIFFIKMEGRRVAGQLLVYENGGVRAWSLGVLNGDRGFVEMGAIKAMHFHLLAYLAEQGFRTVHFGGSRPFLRDGVLKYKKYLGLRVTDDSPRSFAVRLPFGLPAVMGFLRGNPFIHKLDGSYWGLVTVQQGTPEADQSIVDVHKALGLPGLAGLSIQIAPSDGNVSANHPQSTARGADKGFQSADQSGQTTYLPQRCA